MGLGEEWGQYLIGCSGTTKKWRVWAHQEHQHMTVNLHCISKITGSLQSPYGFQFQLSIAHCNRSYDYESTHNSRLSCGKLHWNSHGTPML